jgi:7-keto-8-aminopelargonate synthetase-like enzyme
VFSAAPPAILSVTASESIALLSAREGEDQLSLLVENASTLRSILNKSEYIETISDYNSPIAHYTLNESTISNQGLKTLQDQERLLQDIVNEVFLDPVLWLMVGERPWSLDCAISSDCCARSVCFTT